MQQLLAPGKDCKNKKFHNICQWEQKLFHFLAPKWKWCNAFCSNIFSSNIPLCLTSIFCRKKQVFFLLLYFQLSLLADLKHFCERFWCRDQYCNEFQGCSKGVEHSTHNPKA
jgi:hypothetical protein